MTALPPPPLADTPFDFALRPFMGPNDVYCGTNRTDVVVISHASETGHVNA